MKDENYDIRTWLPVYSMQHIYYQTLFRSLRKTLYFCLSHKKMHLYIPLYNTGCWEHLQNRLCVRLLTQMDQNVVVHLAK